MLELMLSDGAAISYRPEDWYWRRETGPIFSSKRIAYIDATDEEYRDWLARGNVPTPYPRDAAGGESAAELQVVLEPYSLHATLESYAGALRYAQEVAGVAVTIGGADLVVDTSRAMAPTLRSTVMEIQMEIREDGDALKVFADRVPRPLSNADAKAAALAGLAHIRAAFNLESRVAERIRSGTLASKADVEAAFGIAAAKREPARAEPAPAETAEAA